ncbi:TraR/DksA C4-type zinc finger protein [Limnobaculum xujianqingii]|uniref:TraR/DksA C4-type zinc finger protein n=1 Tax=Limnobaculum xujianqingii TaxID=2738837 RepID=UPI001126D268|nr:TraR/DksA C4-type zinc finger protein [Limnobaculum xujianqingii]
MADEIDLAQERQAIVLESQIAAARAHGGVSLDACEDCDRPIPEARRLAITGVTRCVTCQETHECLQKHYRKWRPGNVL